QSRRRQPPGEPQRRDLLLTGQPLHSRLDRCGRRDSKLARGGRGAPRPPPRPKASRASGAFMRRAVAGERAHFAGAATAMPQGSPPTLIRFSTLPVATSTTDTSFDGPLAV